ncbi:Rne/Rng family ribonuclease [Mycobacterium sp. CBMA293]|uniref:Rne/Rng family ribonuclease n=1 Tax=unclassified Mycolicibacterium TaxID=2636767 RepID=UPI00132695FD|nr:Rne/Rng family ribonuclease [Mycolicibacterium sp. CBMA 360]MUL60762.1 Rne/Rng family ribonuclease [Mycolicibacterium sp. CBMA 335]MUL71775.1 Rne/Rng family ribonuclease [Mycolicibacterium sp. CBMA 311]MUL95703.1 Rne/Rng family ribonuclease [Mycolicibacterium sp. CBMA 230]MUM03555.1 ribonuclease E/G [Mycolicibacterium sp. CBMA 213]MUM13090.1 Rne/Rng family ribonuclease [Mycolicibacterium sp. CBMA 293]
MADDAQLDAQSEDASRAGELVELPERLRIFSLARILGTTSKKITETLASVDGKPRNPASTVTRAEAERVRDLLGLGAESAAPAATEPAAEAQVEVAVVEPAAPVAEPEAPVEAAEEAAADVLVEAVDVAEAAAEVAREAAAAEPDSDEPESRLLLEPVPAPAAEPADYLPLFVAPQPVTFRPPVQADDFGDEDGSDDGADGADDGSDDGADDEDGDRPANRRRRRGRRGRGRGRGEQSSDDASEDGAEAQDDSAEGEEDDSDGETDEDAGDDDSTATDGASRRRRRRRRRKSGSGAGDDADGEASSADDPPNTVVHERAPRAKSDNNEIQGITGSTRLEAKRQRRRDGRDAGRRRPPILSEAEFLARREAVERVMVVRDKIRTEPPHEGARYTQIAVLEDGVVVEHFVTSAASASLVGNIYLGIVQNVLPSMEAAFVDIGRGRNGVLYAGEVNWEAAGLGGNNRKIEQALKPGDYVVVQVSKDPVGHKGARLTTQISLAGRYLVYVPGASSTGISRKLPDTERQRLKEILKEVVPADAGVIIRTASEGVKEEDIRTDVNRLQERWNQIDAEASAVRRKAAGAAIALYEEPDVLVKVIRDLFNEDFSKLVVSGDDAWNTISGYVNSVAPELLSRMSQYEPAGGQTGPDVFSVYRIDEQLAKAMDRKVWLPSGGTLVIDRTEAMTVIDVNTGKFTGSGGNLEQTVTRNNLEAAEETVRQLRLRDIGGIVVIDFIDMVLESNRDLVLRRLTEALARDRTRHQVSEVTSLGLVQLTRKRLGTGLVEAFSTTCTHCAGRGIMLHGDPVDTASPNGRKTEVAAGGGGSSGGGGGRRSKRAKKAAPPAEEEPVTKVPPHPQGEHPMFRAMAAANDKHEDDVDADELDEDALVDGQVADGDGGEPDEALTDLDQADDELDADEAEDDEAEDDEADDDDDELEVELDEDFEDSDDEGDDLDLVDGDDEDSDDDESDEDDDEDDEDDADEPAEPVVTQAPVVRQRRRAAARPAGPPVGGVDG